MKKINATLLKTITKADPLTLAILFMGLVSLGAIWLASLAITGA